jgi:hypothetical protein
VLSLNLKLLYGGQKPHDKSDIRYEKNSSSSESKDHKSPISKGKEHQNINTKKVKNQNAKCDSRDLKAMSFNINTTIEVTKREILKEIIYLVLYILIKYILEVQMVDLMNLKIKILCKNIFKTMSHLISICNKNKNLFKNIK